MFAIAAGIVFISNERLHLGIRPIVVRPALITILERRICQQIGHVCPIFRRSSLDCPSKRFHFFSDILLRCLFAVGQCLSRSDGCLQVVIIERSIGCNSVSNGSIESCLINDCRQLEIVDTILLVIFRALESHSYKNRCSTVRAESHADVFPFVVCGIVGGLCLSCKDMHFALIIAYNIGRELISACWQGDALLQLQQFGAAPTEAHTISLLAELLLIKLNEIAFEVGGIEKIAFFQHRVVVLVSMLIDDIPVLRLIDRTMILGNIHTILRMNRIVSLKVCILQVLTCHVSLSVGRRGEAQEGTHPQCLVKSFHIV